MTQKKGARRTPVRRVIRRFDGDRDPRALALALIRAHRP